MVIRTETVQIPSDDPWAVEFRLKKMTGKRASYGMMTDLSLDTSLQWQIQSIDLLDEYVRVTFREAPFDFDSVESLEIETDVQMKKRDLIWQAPPTIKVLEGGTEHIYGSMTSTRNSSQLEFVDGLGRLSFWANARNLACDWDRR